MKKIIIFFMVFLVLFVGCEENKPSANILPNKKDDKQTTDENNMIEIKEKLFIAQTNDIYNNVDEYLGKTIKYEGIFNVYEDPKTGIKYHSY